MFPRVNMSLAGSGQLYVGYVGVLWCFADYGIDIAEIGATSGGAVIAGGVGSGYKPNESMVELACHTLPYKNGLFDPSFSALRNWGLLKGDRIEAKLHELYYPNIGATDLPLHITTSNLDKEEGKVWSTLETPGATLSKVVRASISLPFVFQPVEIDGELHVDGGLTYNSPSGVFKNELPVIAVSFGKRPGPVKKFFRYIESLLNTTVNSNGTQAQNTRKLRIDLGYQGLNYFINDDDVKIMVERAYTATEEWLRQDAKELWSL